MLKRVLLSLSAFVLFSTATPVWAQSDEEITALSAIASPAGMVGFFELSCAACHDNTNPESRAPSRETLRVMDPERVLRAITTGAMAEFVPGLDDERLRAIAELVTGKPFGGTADRTAAAMSNQCRDPLTLNDPFGRPRWNGWTPDPTKSYRFQPQEEGGLNGANVGDLELKWAFAIPGATSAAWAQPTIVGGALFIGSDNNFVYALDAKTGCVHWSFEAPGQVRTAVSIGEVTTVAGARYAAIFGDYMGYVTAVNAETGDELWSMRPDDHPSAKMTGPPVLDPSPGGRLYVPVASWEEIPALQLTYECCKFQGSVVAVDVGTGEKLWATYTFPERPRPLRRNSAGTQLYGPGGGGVWNAPTLDLENRTLYATSGNCYITEFFEQRAGYDYGACDAVFAFDMDSGERLWWTQLLAHDPHAGGCGMSAEDRRINCPGYIDGRDDDPSGSPVLHTLRDGRRILIQGQESGRITALDPDNDGAILWFAQAGDELGSPNGGFGGAFDGEYYLKPLAGEDGSGSVSALRVADGSRVWHTSVPKPSCADGESEMSCHSGNWAAASAVPGAVFTGSRNGVMRAFSTEDGEILWEYDTMKDFDTVNGVEGFGGAFGGAGVSIVDGMLYAGSGYAILFGAPGNVLLAFGLN
jgi:polyvinyl alcohol dehydrogenase (cytochrome)